MGKPLVCAGEQSDHFAKFIKYQKIGKKKNQWWKGMLNESF